MDKTTLGYAAILGMKYAPNNLLSPLKLNDLVLARRPISPLISKISFVYLAKFS